MGIGTGQSDAIKASLDSKRRSSNGACTSECRRTLKDEGEEINNKVSLSFDKRHEQMPSMAFMLQFT